MACVVWWITARTVVVLVGVGSNGSACALSEHVRRVHASGGVLCRREIGTCCVSVSSVSSRLVVLGVVRRFVSGLSVVVVLTSCCPMRAASIGQTSHASVRVCKAHLVRRCEPSSMLHVDGKCCSWLSCLVDWFVVPGFLKSGIVST